MISNLAPRFWSVILYRLVKFSFWIKAVLHDKYSSQHLCVWCVCVYVISLMFVLTGISKYQIFYYLLLPICLNAVAKFENNCSKTHLILKISVTLLIISWQSEMMRSTVLHNFLNCYFEKSMKDKLKFLLYFH